MDKNQQSFSEVSLSPIYPSNNNNNNQHYVSVASPSTPPSSTSNNYPSSSTSPPSHHSSSSIPNSQPTYYVVTDAPIIHHDNFRQTSNLGLLPPSNPGPPYGRWKDSICSWASNLWPSCGCLLVLCGAWHVAQS